MTNQITDERRVCGAKRRNGLPCQMSPMPNGRCRLHGGATPSGIAAGSYKTGRYSKHLPARLIASYQDFINDPDRLRLDDEAGLLFSRISDLMLRVDTGESGRAWQEAKDALRDFQAAGRLVNEEEKNMRAAEALHRLTQAVNRGHSDTVAWNEMGRVIEQFRRLTDTQRRIDADKQHAITTDRAILLITAVLDIIRQNVADRETLGRISTSITALLESGGATTADIVEAEFVEV